jgi:hypothetical protein
MPQTAENSSDGVRLQVAPSDRGPKARTQSCGHTAHGLGSEFGKQAQKTLHLFRPDVLQLPLAEIWQQVPVHTGTVAWWRVCMLAGEKNSPGIQAGHCAD